MASLGTDLNSAYGLLSNVESNKDVQLDHLFGMDNQPQHISRQQQTTPNMITAPVSSKAKSSTPIRQLSGHAPIQQQQMMNGGGPAATNMMLPQQPGMIYDANMFNQQMENEAAMLLQQQQQLQQMAMKKQTREQFVSDEDEGYLDKLFSKKRDILKVIIFSMMILLAISFHTFIECWLKDFVAANEFSVKHELGLRILYPILILVILWNFKAFMPR